MKIKKQFEWEGIPIKIVLRDERCVMTGALITDEVRVLAPNGGIVMNPAYKTTYKAIPAMVEDFLARQVRMHGIDTVKIILTRELTGKDLINSNMGRIPVEPS